MSPAWAALLNSTSIQGFELDDWHAEAPLHSNAIILPAVLASAELCKSRIGKAPSGNDLLLAMIVGYEVGPLVGLGLHGGHVLTMGWHSGAVFGPSAAAASVSKLFRSPAPMIEDALGIACTQACGLMSAQYESDVKRMQHGFAARNGLLAAVLAQEGYVGIKQVYERPYGGFLAQFSQGNGKEPQYMPEEISKDLGSQWKTHGICVKPYASMAGTHATIDCIRALQAEHVEQLSDASKITGVVIELGEAAFHHGGWEVERPLTATGAQMSNAYVAATQLIDGDVSLHQFRQDQLEREELWELLLKTTCELNPEFTRLETRVTIHFEDPECILQHSIELPYGVKPPLSNGEIIKKWRELVDGLIEPPRAAELENLVLNLEDCLDIGSINALMRGLTKSPFTEEASAPAVVGD